MLQCWWDIVWSSPRPSAAARHTAHQHFVYLPSQERCKQDNNIHILLQSVSRQLIVWVGFTSSINHLYFLSCCRFLKQHFVSNNNDSLVNYFLRNFLHLVPKIFYLKNNKSQHSHEMALIAENSKYWPRITSTD